MENGKLNGKLFAVPCHLQTYIIAICHLELNCSCRELLFRNLDGFMIWFFVNHFECKVTV